MAAGGGLLDQAEMVLAWVPEVMLGSAPMFTLAPVPLRVYGPRRSSPPCRRMSLR